MQQLQVNKTNDSQAAAYLYLAYKLSSILSGKRALTPNLNDYLAVQKEE